MKIGFIGAGNMGGAIIGGIVRGDIEAEILVFDKNPEMLLKLSKEFGVKKAVDNKEIAKNADIIFLAVKPNVISFVIDEIKDEIRKDTLIVSIVAGKNIETIETAFGKAVKLIRVMPNTPALVGEGMSALCKNENVEKEELENILEIFRKLGCAEVVAEGMMDAVTAVSGSSPAYVFMLIEAMADAAVLGGLPRNQAYTFASQAVLGAAKMVLETKKHPGELKDMVCSPSGTTIEAVKILEQSGFRSAIIDAMGACIEKSKNM